MASRTKKKPSGALNAEEALVLAFVYCIPGSTLRDVREGTGIKSALAVLRRLRRRGHVRKGPRLWSVTARTAELMAMGSRIEWGGLRSFRLPEEARDV
ncbi:hypothetical protein NR798_24205 [Archangium gephyra]|uniref:hypothetical protein n=1 Tax=Archangium gephyra TaxID=48 RepID=UPI0035D44E2C